MVVRQVGKAGNIFAVVMATAFTLGGLLVAPKNAFAQVGFRFGINNIGGMGIRNTSTTPVTLNSFTVTFTNQTFFDTTSAPPGAVASGFFVFTNNGVSNIILPNNVQTNGQQTATFSFAGFDRNDSVSIGFDLDRFNAIDGLTGGRPAGGLVSAIFSNGQTVTGTIGNSFFNVPGLSLFGNGVSVSAPAVPEPGEYAVAGMLAGTLALGMVRARRRRSC